MNLTKKIFAFFTIILLLLLAEGNAFGQSITQTLRGKIIDQDSHTPLIGANVTVVGSDPLIGASADVNGEFILRNIPIGRITLHISTIGYEDMTIPNILLTSAKEVNLDIKLRESIVQMEELVISGNDNKAVLNEMALISARSFSVEETKRYAGSFNDPARMASSYAGVTSSAEGNNDIVVRGNSPKGIQWRLEGIEIPNPNHFSEEGSTGGPINALNSAMLSNSDFFTGAFPAEYGDAFSGVFDMRLRTGNNENREYAFSLGALGTDIALEGPFKNGGRASYLVNYRYSTLALLDEAGLVDFGGIPKYQDLAFKLYFPGRLGNLTLFGLGGKSHILEEEEEETGEVFEKGDFKSEMGVIGIRHAYLFNDRSYIESSLSFSENGSGYYEESRDKNDVFYETADIDLRKYALSFAVTWNQKLSARHKLQVGARYSRRFFDYFLESWDDEIDRLVANQNEKGATDFLQGFINWKYRITPELTLIGGAHAMRSTLNTHTSLEPRFSMDWQLTPVQNFTLGFGVHGKMASLPTYFAFTNHEANPTQPNKNLDFMKARHYVAGYGRRFGRNLNLKVEAYYQDLYNIPVENDPNSSFALINLQAGFAERELVNEGTGRNYGLEITLERYFANNYYFLATGSLYESKYTAPDGIERDTYFNGSYAGNILGGREFILSDNSKSQKILGINIKTSLIGGRRTTPIDLAASIREGYEIRKEDEAFSLRYDDVFALNLGVNYRVNKPNTSHVFKLDIQNILNNQTIVGEYFENGQIKTWNQLGLLPNVLYTLEF